MAGAWVSTAIQQTTGSQNDRLLRKAATVKKSDLKDRATKDRAMEHRAMKNLRKNDGGMNNQHTKTAGMTNAIIEKLGSRNLLMRQSDAARDVLWGCYKDA